MGTHVLADQWFPRSTTSGSRAKLVLWWSISGRVRCLLAAVDTVRMRACNYPRTGQTNSRTGQTNSAPCLGLATQPAAGTSRFASNLLRG